MTRGHVLVVDDEEVVRELLAIVLRRAGFKVTTAACAEEALSCLVPTSQIPCPMDLILVDAGMPGCSGLDLIQHLRNEGHAAPMVLMSGADPTAPLPQGNTYFFKKPLSNKELIECVNAFMAKDPGFPLPS